MTKPLTENQFITLRVLSKIGGWASNQEIVNNGGNPSSVASLVSRGYVEKRICENERTGFPYQEWKLCNEWAHPSNFVIGVAA